MQQQQMVHGRSVRRTLEAAPDPDTQGWDTRAAAAAGEASGRRMLRCDCCLPSCWHGPVA